MNGPSRNSTPTRSIKKKVSFADSFGFALENVKTIPPYSREDDVTVCHTTTDNNSASCGLHMHTSRQRMKYLSPSFAEPCQTDSFMERVFKQNVCLESISCDDMVVTGVIRVTNIGFGKEVTARYTLDGWINFRDVWADYLSSNLDGKTEQFSFRITAPVDFEVDLQIEFAIRYRVGGYEFWDNNFERNYHVQCLEISQ